MTIEKLPSGSYRIKQMYKGKYYTVTVPNKPTQKEALQLLAAEMDSKTHQKVEYGTFEEYADKYIDYCEKHGKSPSTIRGYDSIKRNLSEDFRNMNFYDMTVDDVKDELDDYAEERSAKSVKNAYGFIRSIFVKYRPKCALTIKLPSAEKKAEYEPSTKDIQAILEKSKGTKYYIAFQLGALGLRRGEILAITSADISIDNVLTINKDVVMNKNGKYVIKNTAKTEASNRRILIPAELADAIRQEGRAFTLEARALNRALHRFQDELGIPRFRFHMLRHFCVAYLHKNGFTAEQIMAWGGWSTSAVMERAYRYNLDPEESQKEIAAKLGGLL